MGFDTVTGDKIHFGDIVFDGERVSFEGEGPRGDAEDYGDGANHGGRRSSGLPRGTSPSGSSGACGSPTSGPTSGRSRRGPTRHTRPKALPGFSC